MEYLGKLHLAGLEVDQVAEALAHEGWPRFRAEQVFRWLHQKVVTNFTSMHNLPKPLINHLQEKYGSPLACQIILQRESIDGTIKYLFGLFDENTVEAVYIPEKDRGTLCVSVQVGCAMNCSFCATGRSGFVRNLSTAEIVSQVNAVRAALPPERPRLSNIVFMGMGEPFANFEAVMAAAAIFQSELGMHLGQRRITISTCGLVPEIRRFADLKTQINLAVSLHAPDNDRRSSVMPINRRYPIEELLDACRYYTSRTNRRISFEYALVEGFNDSHGDAQMLAEILQDMLCHVNIIPVNPVEGFQRPEASRVQRFKQVLEAQGIAASVRKERGTDIEAACGQLRQVHGRTPSSRTERRMRSESP
ncbi:MAG: 23S rRNA (adenine(2503)-C(2))-methyltransferase RlmN [Firmicutes bacterium]|nr:23S rRNA (adenine(2503)-C(2))-methyltransferase RlmN [Bacillota bacterium]